MEEQINGGYVQLAKAMLSRAVKDIVKANGHADEAHWFLKSDWAKVWADVAGQDIHRLRLWTVYPPHVFEALCAAIENGEQAAQSPLLTAVRV